MPVTNAGCKLAGWFKVGYILRFPGLPLAAILLLGSPLSAQIKTGNLSSSMSGTIAPSYNATYGNLTESTHGWLFGGTADYSGSYYNPNFLSFTGSAYLNQSRSNSNFQSISNSSGVNIGSSIFSGSIFPGSINYSKAYDSEGNYSVPGLPNYVTHGNSDSLGISWSLLLPDKPTFSAAYQRGGSDYSVYGTKNTGRNKFQTLNLHSSYRLHGFSMGEYYSLGKTRSLIPQLMSGQQSATSQTSTDSYGFNVSHAIPLNGGVSAGFNRSGWDSSYLGYKSKGTIDILSGLAAIHPTNKIGFTGSVNYSDNLSGQLFQSVISAGGVVPEINLGQTSHSLDLAISAGYSPAAWLQTSASVERRMQDFLGQTYGVTSYSGGASYARQMLKGSFSASGSVTDNMADKSGDNTLGFSANGNYSTEVKNWGLTGSFGYSQNVQTLLVTYMNSSYHSSLSARRKWGRFFVGGSGAVSHTALTQDAGSSSGSQSFNGSIGYNRWLTATGAYARSNGQALATGAGLIPITPPMLTTNLIAYGGKSYSFAVSSTPVKKLIMSAAFSTSTSNTSSTNALATASANETQQFNSTLQYQFRKTYINSGYARLQQGFSATGTVPETVSSYSIGVSRWFNFF